MLFEVLYYIFIFPLEQVLDVIIGVFYHVTKDYGLSIVLLSVCINLFLLKLVLYFDTRAKIINIRKKECDNKIAEFKRVFKSLKKYSKEQSFKLISARFIDKSTFTLFTHCKGLVV